MVAIRVWSLEHYIHPLHEWTPSTFYTFIHCHISMHLSVATLTLNMSASFAKAISSVWDVLLRDSALSFLLPCLNDSPFFCHSPCTSVGFSAFSTAAVIPGSVIVGCGSVSLCETMCFLEAVNGSYYYLFLGLIHN